MLPQWQNQSLWEEDNRFLAENSGSLLYGAACTVLHRVRDPHTLSCQPRGKELKRGIDLI